MAGGTGPITSLPKHVLDSLAQSLAVYSGMPEEIAWGHIKVRGFEPPELDGRGALMRGALLKILSDEVLAEAKNSAEGEFEPEAETCEDERNPSKPSNANPRGGRKAEPASSTETALTRAVGVNDGDDSSDDDEVVSGTTKPRPSAKSDDEEDDDDEDDEDLSYSGESFSEEEEEARGEFWFGKAAAEAPPPPGANPFADSETADFDLVKEAADQIKEAKKIIAQRASAAKHAAEVLAKSVQKIDLEEEDGKDRRAASAKDAAGKDAAAEADDSRLESKPSWYDRRLSSERAGGGAGSGSAAPSEHDAAEDKLDVLSVAGSDFPGSDAGTSVAGGSVAGSVAATHGSEEPPRVDESLSNIGDYDDGASVATSQGALLEGDEDEYGGDDSDDPEDSEDSEASEEKDKENDPALRARPVLRARRPPPARTVSREDETPAAMVVAAPAAAETESSGREKA